MSDAYELELLADMPNYYSWIMDTFAPFVRGHVIEYGAGTGTISRRLEPLAEKLTLVEPSADLSAILRDRFRDDPNIDVVGETLEAHAAQMGDATVETVVMVNVLEHINDDRRALSQLLRTLRPNGHLLIFVPAVQALMSKIDLMFGHFRRYNRPDLLQKVIEAGGEPMVCHYFDCFGVFPWFFLNKVMGATRFNPQLVGIHDKFIVPISRAIEQVVSPPIGKNLILVAQKK
jgi:SAM-dependent methyltransferase